jgi:glycosyltransferase involved in cell wall biosynthesis
MSQLSSKVKIIEISIVVPTYNSSSWITDFIQNLREVVEQKFNSFEIIVVNDGGEEQTFSVLEKSKKNFLKVINLENRVGQHQATWIGVLQASGKFVVTIDDDGEFPANEILTLYKQFSYTNSPIIYGIPDTLKKGTFKILMYKLYLKNLKRTGEARKSSFRLILNKLLKEADYKPDFMMNFDVYLNKLSSTNEFVNVRYTPTNRGRYSVLNYMEVLIKAMIYKQTIKLRDK